MARTPIFRWLVFLTLLAGLASPARALERLEPPEGCYLGFHLGGTDTASALSARLGLAPAVLGRFFGFPFTPSSRLAAEKFLTEVTAEGAVALLTLEPHGGLHAVTTNECVALADLCAAQEAAGITGIMVRFGHEMNANWYAWGQQPILFRETFRRLAQSMHARTQRTALLWAPNHGAGYPFGTARPAPGSADFLALDTNGDGFITESDDMYEPYYPGDDVVDWVGLTVYHWGNSYPWFENEIPEPYRLADSMREYPGSPRVNFYERFCANPTRGKPMAIAETAAFYNTQAGGADEFTIKQAWWRQLFNISGDNAEGPDVATHFPKLKCINWFDHFKQEREAKDSWIDWRISGDPCISAAFVEQVHTLRAGQPYFLTAPLLRVEIAAEAGAVTIRWPSKVGRMYRVMRSSDLAGSVWFPASEIITGTGRVVTVRLTSGGVSGFYRVEVSGLP